MGMMRLAAQVADTGSARVPEPIVEPAPPLDMMFIKVMLVAMVLLVLVAIIKRHRKR